MKKVLIIVGIVIVVVLAALKLYSNKQIINENNKSVDRSGFKIPVTVFTVKEVALGNSFSLPSVLEPIESANIALNTPGKIKQLNFNLGTRVNKGQVIGSLDNRLKQISLQSTQLQVDKLRKDYERTKELFEGNAATKLDLDNTKYNLDNALIQIESLKQQIADGSLTSPISGIITAKNVEVGEFLNMGTTAAQVVDISAMKAIVMVSERDVYRLSEGMPVKILTDIYPGKEITGKISFISPIGNQSHNYQVEVMVKDVKSMKLKAGTFISVAFTIDSKENVLEIPKTALVEGVKNPFVYIAKGDKVEIRKIVLGRDLGESIEVVKGLTIGEVVIISGQINITESSTIEVIKTTK